MKELLFSGLSLLSASIAASDCCGGFNILAAVGIGRSGTCIGLTRYRPSFIALTAVLLGIVFYFAYRKAEGAGKSRKILPWVASGLALGLILFPYYGNRAVSSSVSSGISLQAPQPASIETVVLKIEGQGEMKGMVCVGCQRAVQKALIGVKGVTKADVSLKKQEAVVQYEHGKVNLEDLIKAVEDAGFTAKGKTKNSR